MLTTVQKNEILKLVDKEKNQLGSYTKVAKKIGVSTATITNNIRNQDRWPHVADAIWIKAGKALGYAFKKRAWQVVDTTNSRLMKSVLDLAQSEAMFIAISEKAGSGKSTGIAKYKNEDETNSVFVLQCQEWSRKQFLIHLSQNIGIATKYSDSVQTLGNNYIMALKERAAISQPILILDEADKLNPSALRFLIHFYNELEDEVGLIICGTENLEKEIKRGVAKAVKGYDELDSRLGRNFVHLRGITREDTTAIAEANGITNAATINKIWLEAEPKETLVNNRYVSLLPDLRRLKRIIQRERKFSLLNQ